MLFELINNAKSTALRRLIAALGLLLLPIMALAALFLGTVHYLIDFAKEYFLDLRQMFFRDLPDAAVRLVRAIATGGNV